MTYLSMAEELLCSKVYPYVAYRLPLGLVGRHSKAQSHRELFAFHLDWQRPILWLELDPWYHDVVSYNKTYLRVYCISLTIASSYLCKAQWLSQHG